MQKFKNAFKSVAGLRSQVKDLASNESIASHLRRHKLIWLYIVEGYKYLIVRIFHQNVEHLTREQQEKMFDEQIRKQGLSDADLNRLIEIKKKHVSIYNVLLLLVSGFALYLAYTNGFGHFLIWLIPIGLIIFSSFKTKHDIWCLENKRFGTIIDWACDIDTERDKER